MRISNLSIAGVLLFAFPVLAEDKPTRLWNLTTSTIKDFELAPAGTGKFGRNQCLNDRDSAVDQDERLKITGAPTGLYDARIGFKDGRVCRAKNLSIVNGKIFEIADKDLVDCSK